MQKDILIKTMFELQTQLNEKTNGLSWLQGITKDGRDINWNRCIYMETAEAIDSFNWKHWKDIGASDDWDNLLVEIIDIWHFLMSEAIRLNFNYHNVNSNFIANKNRIELIKSLEKLMQLSLMASITNNNNINDIFAVFIEILSYAGMDIKELYNRYIIKNQLNIFRQDNGYKEGSYNKIWHGKEDNVIAFEIMANNNISPDELYKQLSVIYSKIKD